jgi:Cu(I)/Ag(I) efflux system membrane protein CusA/SilA
VISRWIDWCAQNRFLVFMGTVLLVLTGIWALRHTPLDALPDISDVEVIIHTPWAGQPPSLIEDQVTYPIVTTLLAAPHVKAVRAQTMFGDSYVFVVFEDGTDLYWARSRVLEYMQQITGRLPSGVHPVIGPDATGAGWVYEYALVDHSHQRSLADLRSLQDWYLRYQLATVPGVAEVATIGGFVRQYQVNVDPDRLRAYGIPLSTVIERVRASTNEVGGRLLEMGGAEYMIRGLGYLRSLSDLETVPVATKNGTPVLVRDLGTVTFGPDIREGVAEWQGEGETVGGIVVMRDGMNALTVIDGVKKKLVEIKPSLPPGVEVVSGYDRSGLIHASIETLQRDLLEEAAIVSIVIIIFLFHFRSALIPILTLPIAVLAAFIPMYYLHVTSNIMSLGGLALAIGVLVDAAIVMVENGYRQLSEHQSTQSEPLPEPQRRKILLDSAKQVGPAIFFSLVSSVGVDEDAGRWFLLRLGYHAGARAHDPIHPWTADTRIAQSHFKNHPGYLFADPAPVLAVPQNHVAAQFGFSGRHPSSRASYWKSVHAAPLRRFGSLHADCPAWNLHWASVATASGARHNHSHVPRSRDRLRFHRAFRQRDR